MLRPVAAGRAVPRRRERHGLPVDRAAPLTARVAVVAGPDPGHAFPAVALAVELRRRGHPVAVMTGARWAAAIAREGLDVLPIHDLVARPSDADFGWVLWVRSVELAPGMAATLRAWGPDLAVVDTLTVPGWFAADLAGVPRVELVPHTVQVPSVALPPPGTGLAPGRGVLRARDALLRRLHARSRAVGSRACRDARAALGLPPSRPPVRTLVATLPALEPYRPDWPALTEVVGPMEWDPAVDDLPLPPGDGPLVFVADSSASGRIQTLLAACFGVGRAACTTFGPVPTGLPAGVVAGPGRQAPLLDAASVVVCAGGHGMVCKALVRGLPLVVVPGPGDQRANGLRVQRLGAGVVTSLDGVRRAVARVLADPSYAAAARGIAASGDGLGVAYAADAALAPVITAAPGTGPRTAAQQ